MKQRIPTLDNYINELRQESGSFANVYIDKGIVVKFTKDISEFHAWSRLLDENVYSKFSQTPKIYGLYVYEGKGDKKYVIVMEEIDEIHDALADKIEEYLIQVFDTSYIEEILRNDAWKKISKTEHPEIYQFLEYCNDYSRFCKKIGIIMRVMELQNIGMKYGKFAFFDMGECEIEGTIQNFEVLDIKFNDNLSIAKELIAKFKKI